MTQTLIDRRGLLRGVVALPAALFAAGEPLPPARAITRGPKFHWFGYYDKLEFDPASRYVLGMQVDFEHRSPRPEDAIRIGMVDLQAGDRWIELGESSAWCWQQGCMLQWLPGSKSEVIWNGRAADGYAAHILDVNSGRKRTLRGPVYALSPDASWAVTPDFRRLNDCRPGYGYAGIPDPNAGVLAPEDAGIWKMDLRTGKRTLIISFADAARIPYAKGGLERSKHWFNHLLVAPDGKRFIFLHRWRDRDRTAGPYETRMFTANAEGKDLYVLDPHGKTSHFIWRDPKHVAAWAWHPSHGSKFYVYQDQSDKVEALAPDVMTENGHNTYLPGNRWILNDTYPDRQRLQHPYLYDTRTGKRYPLGHFYSPREYAGEWRCDTHPRFSPDGRKVVIDSPHGGTGRQLWLIDISGILG
ncbi:MAG: hypothetical protein HYZ57_11595 [Acidobacteria bacterium]|nr:hypothetical protein [Acidobacteriota bacterium]